MKKRILSILMALVMIFGCCSYAATGYANDLVESTEVTLTSTDGWNTYVDGDHWVLYLNTSGYSSSDWRYKYEGFTYEIDGVTGTTSQVSSAENNRLYCTIPTSAVPTTEGTIFTIKAGTYEPDDAGTTKGIAIKEDFDIVVVEGRLAHTQIVEAENINAFNNSGENPKAGFYIALQDENWKGVSTGTEDPTWEAYFLNPAWCDGTRVDDGDAGLWSTNYGGVFVDTGEGNKPLNYWEYRFKNVDAGYFYINLADAFTVTNGTMVTVRGFFVSAATSEWNNFNGNFYLNEMKFIYVDANETDDVNGVWKYLPKGENVALNKSVTISDGGDTGPAGLTDGKTKSNVCATKTYQTADNTASFEVDLAGTYEMSYAVVTFRGDSYVPSDFTIDVYNGTEWIEAYRVTDYKTTETYKQEIYPFSTSITGTKVRIQATELGLGSRGYAMQLYQLEVYGIQAAEAVTLENVALNKTVTISDGGDTGPSGLTDGKTKSNVCATKTYQTADNTASFEVDLAGTYEMSYAVVTFRGDSYVPSDFTIDIYNGLEWVEAYRVTDYTTTETYKQETYQFSTSITGTKVRIQATELGRGSRGYAMQLYQLEVYGIPTTDANLITNVALNQHVIISDGGMTPASNLTDGETKANICSSKFYETADNTVSFEIDFEGDCKLSYAVLTFRGDTYVPSDFTIDVYNGTEWVEMCRVKDYTSTEAYKQETYQFPSVITGSKIRIQATKLGLGNEGYALQLFQLEAYGIRLTNTAGMPYSVTATVYDANQGMYGIAWHSAKNHEEPIIQVSKETNFDAAKSFDATVTSKDGYYIYRGIISGLDPSTKYYYRVGDKASNVFTDAASFVTSSLDDSAFTFFHMTDTQGGYSNWNKVLNSAFSKYEANLIVHTGDLVEWGPDESEWKTAFETTKNYTRNILMSSVAGSTHESQGSELYDHFHFEVPNNQDVNYGIYYSYDYNNVHFTMIDINDYSEETGKLGDEQIAWLKQDLEDTDKQWKVVGLHWGLYTSGQRLKSAEISNVRKQLDPIFADYNVDIVLIGHDHVYSRTYPLRNGNVMTGIKTEEATINGTKVTCDVDPSGTVYLMTNTAGNKYYEEAYTEEEFLAKNGQPYLPMFSAITVDGNKLMINAYTVNTDTGVTQLYDTYAMLKNEEAVIHTGTPEFYQGNGASGFYVTSEDGIKAPGWNQFFHDLDGTGNGIFVNGTKVEDINAHMQKTEGNIWYVSLGNGSNGLKAGDEVTVKGKFELENVGTTVYFNAATFVYDGTQFKEKPAEPQEYNGTLAFSHDDGSANGFYVTSDDGIKAPGWNQFFHDLDGAENGIFVNGTKVEDINAHMQKTEGNIWYVSLGNGSAGLKAGDEVTVKGRFRLENVGTTVNFNAATFVWDGAVWAAKGQEIEIDEKDIVFTLDRTSQGGGTINGIYLTATDNVPYDTSWQTNTITLGGKENGVFLNGVKTDVFLKKYDADKYYVCLSDVNVVPEEGDRVTIKGVFKTGDYISSYQEYAVTFKNGSWVDGTEPETKYTTVTVTDYDTNVSKYNEALERWEFYFATKETLPGEVDQRFETVLVEINGEKYYIPCYHGSHRDNLFIIIEKDKLPKIVGDEEITVTISGKAKSADQLLGMDVQKFTLYMNKYGQSLDGFPKAIKVKEKNVKLTLDDITFGWAAGTEAGIWLFTEDKFAVDATWQTPIRAITYDDNSGIFLNGKKIDGYLKKHADGMIYLDIAAAGIFAKDGDKITIKGTFALDGYGVSYAEQTFYYNGQKWDTTYSAPIAKTTTKLSPIGITKTSSFNPERKAWDIYVQVDNAIPGGRDYEYKTLVYEVNGKTYETSVYRVDDSLVFFVPETIVPIDAKDGTAITLKAGTASDNYGIYDIVLTKDATAYVYRKSISGTKPTENTKYLDITIPGLIRTWTFNKDIKEWQLFFIVEEDFDVEDGTQYYDLPVKLNGKSYEEINVFRSGACLYISIPESVLPSDAKSASLTIGKGAKAVANAGWNGIRLKNEVNAYMFDGVWNNMQFTEAEETDLTIKHMNFCSYNADAKRWDIYVNVDKELPGTAWFEYYDGLTAYLNGKEFTTYANKAESENNRLLYISLDEATFGKFKDGDILYIPGDVTWSCGGYKLNNTRDFYLQYVNGIWMEYYESDVKAPEALNSIWEKFRIDGYIPVQEEKGIMFSNVEPTNVIKSVEDMKDVTFTFETTKMMAMNEELPTNSFVLRGQPLSEEMDISETALYGYNVSFSYIELTEANTPNNPELWGTHSQEIAVWKNGINYNLLDQYRMTYNWQKTNHPFFEYNETYKYTVSIYNVTEDICVIEIYCNDELVMRVVDHASDDPMDPARNAGEFQIYAACPQYFNAPAVELDALEVSASECYIGEQVRVSATYPAILEGSEYTVDGEGATIKDGVFSATKEGTYTVKGTYNGKDKGTVQIKVSEKAQDDVAADETSTFPMIPVAITGASILIIATILLILYSKKKKQNNE